MLGPSARLILDPFERASLLFKSENRIDFATTPHNTNRVALPDCVLSNNNLILRLEVS